MKSIIDLIWEPEEDVELLGNQEYISTCCCGGEYAFMTGLHVRQHL